MLYHIVSQYTMRIPWVPGDSGMEILDKLNAQAQALGPIRKRKEGGIEGLPTGRQLANKGYKARKITREGGERWAIGYDMCDT